MVDGFKTVGPQFESFNKLSDKNLLVLLDKALYLKIVLDNDQHCSITILSRMLEIKVYIFY